MSVAALSLPNLAGRRGAMRPSWRRSGQASGMSWTRIRLALAVAALLVVAACGSGGGSGGTLPSVSRPATTPGESGGTPTSERPADSTEKPSKPSEPDTTEAPEKPTAKPPDTTSEGNKDESTTAAEEGSTSDDEGSTTWWPWVLVVLGVAVVIGVIVLVLRRSPKASPWPARTAAVLAEADGITTHLVGLAPEGLAPVASADANRLAALMASVQELITSAPDDTSRRAIAAMQDPLRSLHGALDAIAMTSTMPSSLVVDDLRDRARALHSATSLARASLPPASPV
jgi:hypothetical protein